MSTLAAQTYLTPPEYIALERKATTKSEYLNGQILAMSGASNAHNIITMNTAYRLYNQLLERDCIVYTSDMRVGVSAAESYFYPDVVVVCDEPRFEDNVFDTLLNPTVVIEVLSPSTAAYDRGEKFDRYQQLASLQEYLLISQDRVCVEHYIRQASQWLSTECRSLEDVLPIVSIQCELHLRHIYRRVTLARDL